MHIAMWSGPRNLSTALMYSFASRPEFRVIDEPFYGAYLKETGADHPMRDDIIASMETDPARIARTMEHHAGEWVYSKQMAHHMVEGFPLDWMKSVTNVFLIRHPARVLASYAAKRENPSLADTGVLQQLRLFEMARDLGQRPVVVDSLDILGDPQGVLGRLCAVLGLRRDDRMLEWRRGGHPADGIWARHWYGSVHESTGFGSAEKRLPELDGALRELAEEALPHYEQLSRYRL